MKKIYQIAFLACAIPSMVLVSCDKKIDETEDLRAQAALNIDADAGNWDMIVLNANNQIVVAPPADPQSDAYKAELASIKDIQSKLTPQQRGNIEFWSGGGILRWNQKLRELVARYNVPPTPKPDGTYPAPDAENPFSLPEFPFSNPPYAARAYSYVSVAQYEALKSAWYYKHLYTRESPYKIDATIQSLMPEVALPAYPSEEAVMSGVTAEMLKALFPAAIEEITIMAASQRNAALWSGKAAASDITAGLALGKAVADEMKKRAGTDGMGAALGNPALWKQLKDSVGFGKFYKSNETAWTSREIPARPPMLPNFGKVKAWNMTADDIVEGRPAPPPETASEEMKKETEEVKYYADNLTRERMAIVHKWADGTRTYTPPGHWNDIAAEYIRDANWSEVRVARAFALLNMALHDAAVCCWDTKFFYFNPRPSQLDPSIKTGTGIPNFPAFTSGHSTFSGSAATVLAYLFPEHTEYFMGQADEASVSRLYGGIHYRYDIEKGLVSGKMVGSKTVTYALSDGADAD